MDTRFVIGRVKGWQWTYKDGRVDKSAICLLYLSKYHLYWKSRVGSVKIG